MRRVIVKPRKCPKCGERSVFHGLIDETTLGEKCSSCGYTKERAKISIAFLNLRRRSGKNKKKKRMTFLQKDDFPSPDEFLWPP